MKQYTFKAKGILDRIVVPCTIDVCDYETANSSSNIKKTTVRALWDTGSTVTVISENLIKELGLIPSDVSRVSGWDGKPITTNTYNIDILLDELRIDFVNAVRGPLRNIDMIIGMDIIGQGDSHITHPSFNTILEFILN